MAPKCVWFLILFERRLFIYFKDEYEKKIICTCFSVFHLRAMRKNKS